MLQKSDIIVLWLG